MRYERRIDPQDAKLRLLMATGLCKSGNLANGIDLLLEGARAHA